MDWNQAIKYGQLVKIAEGVRPGDEYQQTDKDKLTAAGYEYLQTIYGDDLATDIDAHLGDTVSFGFLALSSAGELVAAIRGTDTILEWMHDAEFLMVPSPVRGVLGVTDDGFTAIYKSLRLKRLESDAPNVLVIDFIRSYVTTGEAKTVTLCGHSLGAALATLLTADVAVNTGCGEPLSYTFASPRVGDHIFAGEYKKTVLWSYRIANRFDLVTKLPTAFPLPYEHVETHCELKPTPDLIGSIPCEHHLTTYLHLMGQLVGSTDFPLDSGCKA
jgi:hypothetical protein